MSGDNEWCTGCKEYDHEKHCCPRFNNVIRETVEELGIIHCRECKHVEHDKQFHEFWCMGKEVTPDHSCENGERRNDE